MYLSEYRSKMNINEEYLTEMFPWWFWPLIPIIPDPSDAIAPIDIVPPDFYDNFPPWLLEILQLLQLPGMDGSVADAGMLDIPMQYDKNTGWWYDDVDGDGKLSPGDKISPVPGGPYFDPVELFPDGIPMDPEEFRRWWDEWAQPGAPDGQGGWTDWEDLDYDGDGLPNGLDDMPYEPWVDSDGDGLPDYNDPDPDNHGDWESPLDSDGDGIPDNIDPDPYGIDDYEMNPDRLPDDQIPSITDPGLIPTSPAPPIFPRMGIGQMGSSPMNQNIPDENLSSLRNFGGGR